MIEAARRRARPAARALAACLLALLAAGCDKCGNRVHINAPTLQHACGDDAGPAR